MFFNPTAADILLTAQIQQKECILYHFWNASYGILAPNDPIPQLRSEGMYFEYQLIINRWLVSTAEAWILVGQIEFF